MSRRRRNRFGVSGDYMSTSARWKLCRNPTGWREVNDGAPGIDGVTFEAIEESGVESFLRQIRKELVTNTYRPMRARKKEIPKDGGKVRVLSIPAIRDRVV
jgi:retron-type reverse transcriptase